MVSLFDKCVEEERRYEKFCECEDNFSGKTKS